MKTFFTKSSKAFTLIELMVVIAIIGLLASIISISLVSSRAKSRDAKRISDIRTIQLALETYYSDNGSYPTAISTLVPTYIPVLPKDPKDNTTDYQYYAVKGSAGTNCVVASPPPPTSATGYHLGAGLEDATNPVLKQDTDAGVYPGSSVAICAGGTTAAGFDGWSTAVVSGTTVCSGTSHPLQEGTCYDVTN